VEIFLVVLVIVVVFFMLLGLFAAYIHSSTGINVFVAEKSSADSGLEDRRSDSEISERRSSERLKNKISSGIRLASQFVSNLKSHGLFVTVKLTLSFVQVLLGTLPRLSLDVDNASSPSFVFSVDLNPMHYVPILSECTSNNTLDRPFAHILVILFLPAMFAVMIFIARRLVVYLMRRNASSLLSSSVLVVDRAMFDVTLKAVVWFCLFSFPVLTSG
jgi:uncharacterized membrane protein